MTGRWLEAALAVVLGVLAVILVLGLPRARAHDIYRGWMVPGTATSCCNDRDCRPTRARMTDGETWQAWDGARWVDIPPARVLRFPSPDGRSHVCISPSGEVLCFVPAGAKS